MDGIAGINSLAAQVKVGLSSYKFLSPQGLLEPALKSKGQVQPSVTMEDPKGVALGANQVSSLSLFNQ